MGKGTGTLLRYPYFGSTVVGRNVSPDPRISGRSVGKSELRSFDIPRINLNVRKNLKSSQLTLQEKHYKDIPAGEQTVRISLISRVHDSGCNHA